MEDTNDYHMIEITIFIVSVISGFFPAAALFPHCDDVGNFIYSKLFTIRIVTGFIIGLITLIGIIDVLGLGRRPNHVRQAKAFAIGLGLGMTIYQIISIIMNSNCFRVSWLLPFPSG